MTTTNINQDDYTYLYESYNWFSGKFPENVQEALDDFFVNGLRVSLLGISKNINILMEKEAYFVTKIRIDKFRDIYFRASEKTTEAILYRALGNAQRAFSINKLTDLETKIVTSFNDSLFNKINHILSPAPPTVKRINFDVIHLTFLIKNEEIDKCGKFIITIPEELLSPERITSTENKFEDMDFASSFIDVNIKIGTTKFSVFDLKALEEEDIVVFDQSNTKKLTLIYKDYEKEFNINPNLGLVLPIDNEEDEKMGADNLWDSIEVEMIAQFEAVKVTLGELKKIEAGQVIDITPIYDNKVTLSVEDKTIAKGSLVIVNDKYGVKIDEIAAASKKTPQISDGDEADNNLSQTDEDFSPVTNSEDEDSLNDMPAQNNNNETEDEEDEFDYSDFELEDEDI